MGLQPEQLYLTHYSRVTDLARLADDMHQRIDDLVAIAREHASDNNRTEAMQTTLFSYSANCLETHGVEADEDRLHAILDLDVELNTMRIEYWLDRVETAK